MAGAVEGNFDGLDCGGGVGRGGSRLVEAHRRETTRAEVGAQWGRSWPEVGPKRGRSGSEAAPKQGQSGRKAGEAKGNRGIGVPRQVMR